jgi:hypothetical protein
MAVHCEEIEPPPLIPTSEAEVILPYESTVIAETVVDDPYDPAMTPLAGQIPKFVAFIVVVDTVVALRVVTFVVERLEVPETFKFVPKIEDPLRVTIFVVERLEVPETFKFVPKIEDPLRVTIFVVERLEVPETFKFVPKIEDPLRVAIFVVERLEVPETFKFVPKIEDPLRVERFESPVTFKFCIKIDDGKSSFTSNRNVGAPDPMTGPAKT